MLRTFNEHVIRPEISLDGWWDFITAPERRDRARLPRRYTRRIHCPRAWETTPGLEAYRGKAWFRRTITLPETQGVRLVFGGVSHTATVFLDGKQIGTHYDAFTPFACVAASLAAGQHEIVVEVDNSFGDHSALHIENDYYTYGGITRPAVMQTLEQAHIARLHAVPRAGGESWALDVELTIKNIGRAACRRAARIQIAGRTHELGETTIKGGQTAVIRSTLTGIDAAPWSAANPALYMLEAILSDQGRDVDDLRDRIGFREIAVKGDRLLLNGEPLLLRGYNRHEDHPHFGNAIPVEAMAHDLSIVKDLGCNFVRTCHYPNDRRFLDLCDESGVFVWEESHARDVSFKHPKFREQIASSTTEMVDWHRNHPSIVIWGCLNECDSVSREGRAEHERVIKLIKKLDPSRPVTFASNKGDKDICLDLVDVVSWNIYPAWYTQEIKDIEPRLARALAWQKTPASKARGKPVILSEFGAGAIYGCRAPHRAKWTEEYQADVLDECLRVFLNHPAVSGVAIWQFCDVRVTRGWWNRRPRTFNNKGTVDEYRRPKLAYDVVKKRMHEARARRERSRTRR